MGMGDELANNSLQCILLYSTRLDCSFPSHLALCAQVISYKEGLYLATLGGTRALNIEVSAGQDVAQAWFGPVTCVQSSVRVYQ